MVRLQSMKTGSVVNVDDVTADRLLQGVSGMGRWKLYEAAIDPETPDEADVPAEGTPGALTPPGAEGEAENATDAQAVADAPNTAEEPTEAQAVAESAPKPAAPKPAAPKPAAPKPAPRGK